MWRDPYSSYRPDPNPRYNSQFCRLRIRLEFDRCERQYAWSRTAADLPGMIIPNHVMIPDLNFGVVILTNTLYGGSGLLPEPCTQTIIDSYLGLDDFGWTDKTYASLSERLNKGDEVSAKGLGNSEIGKKRPHQSARLYRCLRRSMVWKS